MRDGFAGRLVGIAVGALVLATAGAATSGSLLDRAPVSQRESRSAAADARCSGASGTAYSCYQKRYANLVRDGGVSAAFTALKAEYEGDRFVRSVCHSLAHAIGRAAADLYTSASNAFSHGDHFCRGYYHGVMERTLSKIGAERVLKEAPTLCAEVRRGYPDSVVHLDCAHGLGHGFMAVYRNELFVALEGCDTLPDPWERQYCYSGVFMENRMAGRIHPSRYLRDDEPLYPCTVLAHQYVPECYRSQISYALRKLDYDFGAAFHLCAAAGSIARRACYGGLGAEAFRVGNRENVTDVGAAGTTYALCALGESYEARAHCVRAAVRNFISYQLHSAHQAGRVDAFCSVMAAPLRLACSQAAAGFYRRVVHVGPGKKHDHEITVLRRL